MKIYAFTIEIVGGGDTVEAAWEDAQESFYSDPGDPPVGDEVKLLEEE